MLGINYDASDWTDMRTMMLDANEGILVPQCGSDLTNLCGNTPIHEKCQELFSSGEDCKPVCLVTVKRAG